MKYLKLLVCVMFVGFSGAAHAAEAKRVLMIVNEGFYAPEYYHPRKIFDDAGFKVTVAAKETGMISPDKRNKEYSPVRADLAFEKVDLAQFDAVTFAGGNGAWTDYFPNESAHRILKQAFQRNMVTGLICSSTGLLAVAGNFDGQQKSLVEGRHITGYYRVEGLLRSIGKANYDAGEKDKPYVVTDGNLITGRDPLSSELFGKTVAKKLLGSN